MLPHCIETLSARCRHRSLPSLPLPSSNDEIAIERIQFDQPRVPFCSFAGHEGGTRASQRIEDNVTAIGDVNDGVGE